MDGENGWALAFVRISRDYEADEKAAREAKAGMWQGAFIAPWDWRARNKKTTILGAAKPPENASTILLASASGPVAPSPDCTIKGNVNRAGECIYHTAGQPLVRARSRCISAKARAGSARSRTPKPPAAARPRR